MLAPGKGRPLHEVGTSYFPLCLEAEGVGVVLPQKTASVCREPAPLAVRPPLLGSTVASRIIAARERLFVPEAVPCSAAALS